MDDHIFCPNGCYSSTSVWLKWKLVQMTSPQTRRVVRSGLYCVRSLFFEHLSKCYALPAFLLFSLHHHSGLVGFPTWLGNLAIWHLAPGKSETKKPQKSSCKPHPCSCWRRSQLFLVFMLFFVFFFKPHTPNSCFPAAKVIFFVTTESCCYPTCNDETLPSLCQKRNRQHGQVPLKSPDDLFHLQLQTLTGRCVSRVARIANAVPCHSFPVTSLWMLRKLNRRYFSAIRTMPLPPRVPFDFWLKEKPGEPIWYRYKAHLLCCPRQARNIVTE